MSKTVKASIIIGGSMSSSFRAALGGTRDGLKRIGAELANVERKQRLMGRSIDTFGRMGKNVDGLRRRYAELTREADRLRSAQSRLANVQSRIAANSARRQELGGKVRGAATMFGVAAAAAFAPVRQAVEFETAMLGVAKQVAGARDESDKLTSVYFDMQRQIQKLGREIPLRTNDLADMVAAGARMGVAKDELIDFTKTAAMMADAFELPAGELADNMGQIAGLFKIPIPQIGNLADAINYLDDNALSKGGDIVEVLRRIGGMASAMKMPSQEAAALGSTFLSLGSQANVAATATNAIMRILGSATAQSKRVRTGLADLGMTAAGVQKGMSTDATGTILSVLDKLNSMDAEGRMVAAVKIFGGEYGDDIAKLATGTAKYREQLELVNSAQSKGSMSREFNARLETTAAKWQLTKNRISEVANNIGGALLPAVNDLFGGVGPVIQGFGKWSRENPKLIRGIVGATLAVSGLRLGVYALAYAWTLAKTPVLGVMGFIAKWRAGGAVASLGRMAPAALRLGGILRTVGVAIAAIGGGPIAIAVAALTAGALLVRKYWQPIAAFFSGFASGLRSELAPVFTAVGAALAPLKPLWNALSGAIAGAWEWITKLIAPVDATAEQLKAAAGSGRSFGRVIGAVMAFVLKPITAVSNAIRWIGSNIGRVAKLAGAIPGVAALATTVGNAFGADPVAPGKGGKAPGKAAGRRAPGAPAVASRAGTTVQQTHTYHITQQPGESGEALARRVAEHNKRRRGVELRGSLVDAVA